MFLMQETWRVPGCWECLGPGARKGPIKGKEMELVFIEPLLCAGVI